MSAILGIDAAWTATEPSGVALVVKDGLHWRLRAAASSYDHFLALLLETSARTDRPRGSVAQATALLNAAESLAGCNVSLIAIDMPLSNAPIRARRVSDNRVSSAYGARYCSTHTPNALRPGKISDDLKLAFESAGYPLLTREISGRGLLEVYPHPALVELTKSEKRLPYKHSKIGNYWRSDPIPVRRAKLIDVWRFIVAHLDERIAGVADALIVPQANARAWEMKAFEDMMDAVVCAWIGICALEGDAIPYGDDSSAIWIPSAG
ncbi:DUF429 domain-containing protein [Agrobacterium salinitolerans]|uniref:DUF429 domain-containing protein n=1 Tax=Agrobacterium salinitolerans TaxID=1183413 RepID=UPI001FDA0933|nr:DUF429 domain-containing protein [Agrobacterium salinitolerans]